MEYSRGQLVDTPSGDLGVIVAVQKGRLNPTRYTVVARDRNGSLYSRDWTVEHLNAASFKPSDIQPDRDWS